MSRKFNITVRNRLITEKRDINIYHHSTRSAHIISRASSLTIPLKGSSENDYLHISLVSGPGNLWRDCLLSVPSWADLEFSCDGRVTMTHCKNRTIIKIPPGPPTWQLRISRPAGACPVPKPDQVTIGDEGPGEGG